MSGGPAVLLMAHGSPDSLDQMGEFLRRIFGARPVPDAMVREFQERYKTFGGRSPLADICRRQAAALQKEVGLPVRVGMRHWHPLIAEAVRDLGDPIVGIALAPQYSVWSVAKYHAELRTASTARVVAVDSWHLQPRFLDAWADRIRAALEAHRPDAVLFTAHSIPAKDAEPYPHQLRETVEHILVRIGPVRWKLAYQSASPGARDWLGPDVDAALAELQAKRVLAAPIGFLSDHAEVLYDLDRLHKERAAKRGITLLRATMLNDHPLLISALADVVRQALGASS